MAQQRQIPLQAGTHTPKLLIPLSLTLVSAKDKALGSRVLCHASGATLTPPNAAEIRVAMGHTLPLPNLCWRLSVGPNTQTVITTQSCLLWVTYYHTGYGCLTEWLALWAYQASTGLHYLTSTGDESTQHVSQMKPHLSKYSVADLSAYFLKYWLVKLAIHSSPFEPRWGNLKFSTHSTATCHIVFLMASESLKAWWFL